MRFKLSLFLLICISQLVLAEDERFNIDKTKECFESALNNTDSISLGKYNDGFKEISKIFKSLGSVFKFVDVEIKSCINELESKYAAKNPAYGSIQSAVEYELNHNLLRDKRSASKIIALFQNALQVFTNFLFRLSKMNGNGDASSAARKAYLQTLGKRHNFAIKTIAQLALHSLPRKKRLLNDALGIDDTKLSEQELNEKLAKFATVMDDLFKSVDKFYESKGLRGFS